MNRLIGINAALASILVATIGFAASQKSADEGNLPADHALTGGARFGSVGDERRDVEVKAFSLDSRKQSGSVTRAVKDLSKLAIDADRWFRFTFRGLPEANFAVAQDDLTMKIAFLGSDGKTSYDAKEVQIFDQIRDARKNISVNGVGKRNGAETWQTFSLEFRLPFAEVDQVELSVRFGHGTGKSSNDSAFLIEQIELKPIPAPASAPETPTKSKSVSPTGKLLPLGGRWFYAAKDDESVAPTKFDTSNVDRLLYHDAGYSAPFAGNTSALLRKGFKDLAGTIITEPRLIEDSVTIEFTKDAMRVTSHSVPNHPTGRFPEIGFGNPNIIREQIATYSIPLNPKPNPSQKTTDTRNANGALHMGPIGVATNGVVFFNPFDMGNRDATDMMDRCCGHPNQDGQYHYHKYPVCVNTPWSDDGKQHSPLLGWAFDGYPVYGPYESAGVMAKNVKGPMALNDFNLHEDADRGPHYHVTPGKFPYLIGGFWGVEDASNGPRRGGPRGGGMREGGPPGRGNRDGRRGPPAPPFGEEPPR